MPAEPIGPHMTATPVGGGWIVNDKRGGVLGRIAWYARWNQYEFLPSHGSGYSGGCCRDLAKFLDRVTAARKAGGGS